MLEAAKTHSVGITPIGGITEISLSHRAFTGWWHDSGGSGGTKNTGKSVEGSKVSLRSEWSLVRSRPIRNLQSQSGTEGCASWTTQRRAYRCESYWSVLQL